MFGYSEIGWVFELRLPRAEEELFRRRSFAHWLSTNQLGEPPVQPFEVVLLDTRQFGAPDLFSRQRPLKPY